MHVLFFLDTTLVYIPGVPCCDKASLRPKFSQVPLNALSQLGLHLWPSVSVSAGPGLSSLARLPHPGSDPPSISSNSSSFTFGIWYPWPASARILSNRFSQQPPLPPMFLLGDFPSLHPQRAPWLYIPTCPRGIQNAAKPLCLYCKSS